MTEVVDTEQELSSAKELKQVNRYFLSDKALV